MEIKSSHFYYLDIKHHHRCRMLGFTHLRQIFITLWKTASNMEVSGVYNDIISVGFESDYIG